MNTISQVSELLYEKTKDNPLFLHIDSIGLLKLGKNNGKNINEIINNKLQLFKEILINVEKMGGNILIPTFSYTITSGDTFDVLNTPSETGSATEYLRKEYPYKRTFDPIFSYLVFSKNKSLQKDFKIKNFNTFSENSIIQTVYEMDGYIGSIGDVLWRTTEAHFFEKKLDVSYRFDKKFTGKIEDYHNKLHLVESTFYCRKLNTKLQADFKPIINTLEELNFVENWNINDFNIESVKMKDLYNQMKIKYKENKLFFCKDEC